MVIWVLVVFGEKHLTNKRQDSMVNIIIKWQVNYKEKFNSRSVSFSLQGRGLKLNTFQSALTLSISLFGRNNQKFPVTIDDLAAPSAALLLKTQIFSLTGVPNDRQKIMVKGGLLKDDANLTTLNFKEVCSSFLLPGIRVRGLNTTCLLCKPPSKLILLMLYHLTLLSRRRIKSS